MGRGWVNVVCMTAIGAFAVLGTAWGLSWWQSVLLTAGSAGCALLAAYLRRFSAWVAGSRDA